MCNIRSPSFTEKKLLKLLTDGCIEISSQLEMLKCLTIDEYGSIKLFPNGNKIYLPDGPFKSMIMNDLDTINIFGPYINIILFIKDGFISELQIYKDDGSKILSGLDPSLFREYK